MNETINPPSTVESPIVQPPRTKATRKNPIKRKASPIKARLLALKEKKKPLQKKVFCESLAKMGTIRFACEQAGISRDAYYAWVGDDEVFRSSVSEAIETYKESLEEEVHRRGMVGIEEPVVYQGKLSMVAVDEKDPTKGERPLTINKKSDILLIFKAKAEMRGKYGDDGEARGAPNDRERNLNAAQDRNKLFDDINRKLSRIALAKPAQQISFQSDIEGAEGVPVPVEGMGETEPASSI